MELDLSGTWRAEPSSDQLRRTYQLDSFDDSGWHTLSVPGHWQRNPAFATLEGPILYRTRFDSVEKSERIASNPSDRHWLVFDGVFYQSDVWLDGTYLGDAEGSFSPHEFEITDAVNDRSEHVLAVEVTCAPQRSPHRKRNLTGAFQTGSAWDRGRNPGGIWRPVRVATSGPVRIKHHRVLCTSATERRATIRLRSVLDARAPGDVTVVTTIDGDASSTVHSLALGENQLEWDVVIDHPRRWWPHALGDQPMYEVEVAVNDTRGRPSDARSTRLGLRSVAMNDWVTTINGERIFLKGTNQGPTDHWLGDCDPETARTDLELARAAHLDMMRVHGHIARPEFYEAADELGMLLWQDFPMLGGYHRSTRKQATAQARAAVDALAHHPSIITWSAHNTPFAAASTPDTPAPRSFSGAALRQQLPTYNKSVLDRAVSRALRRADGSRPVIEHSGMVPTLPTLDTTDTHLYFGWYHGDERQLPAFARAWPRMVRFVGEFGSQSVPAELDHELGDDYGVHLGAHRAVFDRTVPPASFADAPSWAEATRHYQAMLTRFHVETLRRLKYRPTGGFSQFCFADSVPGISMSVVSYDRIPKEAYQALTEACRPVIAVADRFPAHFHGGEALAIDLHVVSDLRVPIDRAALTATLTWAAGSQTYRYVGGVDADSVARIGTIQMVVPEADGPLVLELDLTYEVESGGEVAVHAPSTYRTYVLTGEHEH